MAGVYIHIPFCKTRCHYCDFYKLTDFNAKADFLSALRKEIVLRKNELSGEQINTIYFGGGTPSVLKAGETGGIMELIGSVYDLDPDAEITLEANPDDLNVSFARELLGAGINRLSIGIQSFGNQDLKNMNRRHDAARALACIDAVREAGFTNLSIDLIYGLPDQDLAAWEENVNKAVGLKADHVSAYHLTYHKGTVFYNYLKRGKIKEIPDELSFAQFNKLRELLVDAGYEHYEISNFARDKQYSKHNRSYWERKNYLGFGPSAHSFDQRTRRWNISNLKKYLSAVENDQVFWKTEILSEQDQYNDFMITSLRTMWGISQQELDEAFQVKYSRHFRKEAVPFMETGHMLFDGTCYTLSEKGLFISDTIMEKLLFVESA